MSHTALRLAGITKRYRSNTVLGPIDLSLEEGASMASSARTAREIDVHSHRHGP